MVAQSRAVPRRLTPLLLILAFAALGSGLLEQLHRRAHAAQVTRHQDPGQAPADQDDHSESTCAQCLALHLPTIISRLAGLLICIGFIGICGIHFPDVPALPHVHSPIDCRGPPLP